MIRVTLSYPRVEDATFDEDYYVHQHASYAAGVFTALGMIRAEADVVLAQVRADVPDVFAVTTQYWNDLDEARAAFRHPSVDDVRADAHHFYNGTPTVRFSTIHTVHTDTTQRKS